MTETELTQFVVFTTALPADRFVETWRPFAAGFLAAGLGTITLASFADGVEDGIAFVSRNTWPEADYRRAFPGGLAADAGGGPVAVRQAGVFAVDPAGEQPIPTASGDQDLSLALIQLPDPSAVDAVVAAALAAVPAGGASRRVAYRGATPGQRYQAAVTVHGPSGTGAATSAALRASLAARSDVGGSIVVTGREVLSLQA